jgi:flagellar protein FliS
MNNPYQTAMDQYEAISLETKVDTASQHELINMLLQGARTHIATAQGNIQRHQLKEKGEHLGRAITIIDGLKACLNHNQGGEIAENLDKLYDYIQQNILKASLHKDAELLAHVNILLANIHQAWQAIEPVKN